MILRSRTGSSSSSRHNKPPSSSYSSGGSHEFFKVYLPDQSSKQLRIPPAFVRHLRGPFPMASILEGPTGKAWFVNVKEVDGSVVLEKGWENFVEDTCLEFGEFLMFSYNGFSKFKVTIYGKNGCEKEFDARKVEQRGKIGNSGKDLPHENGGTIVVKVEESEETPIESDTRKHKCRTSDARAVQEDKKTKNCKELLLSPVNDAQPITLRPGRSLLNMQNDNAVKAAKKFKSKNPHFMLIMHKSFLTAGRVTVPINFVKEYMTKNNNLRKAKNSKVELRITNKIWDVELKLYLPRRCVLANGWVEFARANRLLEGDVCVFELTNTDDFVFGVSIFRS